MNEAAIELPPAMALVLAFAAGFIFCVAVCVLRSASSGNNHKPRRLYLMEIVRVGRRGLFKLLTDPPVAVLDEQDAPVRVEVSDPALVEATLEPFVAGEARNLKVRTLAPGTASVQVVADADLDPGEVRTLIAQIDLEITEGGVEAQSITLERDGAWEDDTQPS